VRDLAVSRGADEAVLTTDSGVVIEAAHSSILWWEDETLCLPPPELLLLAGVTSGLIQDRAHRSGIPVAHRLRTVPELDNREVWLVNALHGIRPVTGWTGRPNGAGPLRAGPAGRAAEWRSWLAEMADPLPED
jgi:branched-subunit amino acid aminotransferase/4-amino-4-deoxychorismate lyase